MKMRRISGLAILTLLLLHGCQTKMPVTSRNMAVNYDPSLSELHPVYNVFHPSDSTSELAGGVPRSELQFVANGQDEPKATIDFHYRLFERKAQDVMLDSGTARIEVLKSEAKLQTVHFSQTIRSNTTELCILELNLRDVNSKSSAHRYLTMDRSSKFTRQNYKATYVDNNQPVLTPFVEADRKIKVSWNQSWSSPLVQYYQREFPLAPPPFAAQTIKTYSFTADSIYQALINQEREVIIEPHQIGFYHLNPDTSQKEGITFFVFNDSYPFINDTNQLIEPLRYLSSKKEYLDITSSNYAKSEVDKFWLRMAGDKERARDLIKEYYSRIHESNYHFSSYTEGWRTDRGMTYIVFGPPNSVFIEKTRETWLYGEEGNYASWNFIFNKVENPFSDQDYQLERSPNHRTFYHQAVETWREGRSFTSK